MRRLLSWFGLLMGAAMLTAGGCTSYGLADVRAWLLMGTGYGVMILSMAWMDREAL